MRLTLEIGTFEDMNKAIPVMARMARKLGVEVVGVKSGIVVVAWPNESARTVMQRYLSSLEHENLRSRDREANHGG